MRRSILALSLLGLLLLIAPPPAFAPTAVEYILGAGPLGFLPGDTVRMGLLVPAVQPASLRLTFLNRGDVLLNFTLPLPDPTPSGFHTLFVDVLVDPFTGHLMIGDGAGRSFDAGRFTGRGELSILIGLLLPAIQTSPVASDNMTASLQLVAADGSVRTALPFMRTHVAAAFSLP